MTTSFADLGLPADLVDVLARQRITTPFEIQIATIPDALAGRDVLGRAPTGSGKTLAFGLPLVVRLEQAKPRRPKALILSPTRELAEQIRAELEPLLRERGRSGVAVYGGVGFRDQTRALRNGVDLLVACPGRLIDLIEQGEVSLNEVNQVVIDEADRMADMGFLPPVRKLLDMTSPDRQTTLFSATLDRDVQVIVDSYQNDPVRHEFGPARQTLDERATHRFIKTQQNLKVSLAADVITSTGTTIVFCRTRHGVDRVARQLKNAGVKAGWIHGGRSQNQRDAALDAFVSGRVGALVATDVAARGIHVDDVAGVIHFDPPEDAKTYIHRSGRTARAGAGGVVVSFVNADQHKTMQKMQKELGLVHGFEETPELTDPQDRPAPIRDEPAAKSAGQGRGPGRGGAGTGCSASRSAGSGCGSGWSGSGPGRPLRWWRRSQQSVHRRRIHRGCTPERRCSRRRCTTGICGTSVDWRPTRQCRNPTGITLGLGWSTRNGERRRERIQGRQAEALGEPTAEEQAQWYDRQDRSRPSLTAHGRCLGFGPFGPGLRW